MKIPNNIEKMTWNIPTHDAYERTNEIIEAVNFLLERARNGEAEIRENERLKCYENLKKECKYLLACGMGKKKSLEHLIKILEKEKKCRIV